MPCCELTMKNVVLYLLLLFPALAWAQKDLVIEGPNDKVAPVTLQVKSDFDQDKGVLKLMITGDNTDECNALKAIQQRIQRLIEVHSSGLMPVNVMIVKS